jgi:hypothetical protein
VPHRAGAGAKGGIGHQHRARGIIGEADVEQLARRRGAQRRRLDHRRNLARERQRRELVRELKAPRFGGLRRVDDQVAHRRIEIAQHLVLAIDDRNAQRLA